MNDTDPDRDAAATTAGAVVSLRDGSRVCVRPVTPADRPAVEHFLVELSPRSLGLRFFGHVDLGWAARWSTEIDDADRFALVAVGGPEAEVLAHAAYVRTGADRAEVAFAVADAWQEHGIATIMLACLAAAAREHGIATFTADVLRENHRMIAVFRDSGLPMRTRLRDASVVGVELATECEEATRGDGAVAP